MLKNWSYEIEAEPLEEEETTNGTDVRFHLKSEKNNFFLINHMIYQVQKHFETEAVLQSITEVVIQDLSQQISNHNMTSTSQENSVALESPSILASRNFSQTIVQQTEESSDVESEGGKSPRPPPPPPSSTSPCRPPPSSSTSPRHPPATTITSNSTMTASTNTITSNSTTTASTSTATASADKEEETAAATASSATCVGGEADEEQEEEEEAPTEQGNSMSSSFVLDELKCCQHQINVATIALEQLRKVN